MEGWIRNGIMEYWNDGILGKFKKDTEKSFLVDTIIVILIV
jgi:hypothetical protein